MGIDYLVLVNKSNKIPIDYIHNLELIIMHGYDNEVYSVEKTTAAQFCELQKAAAQIGIEILLTSAYRSVERQQEISDEMLEEYLCK
jgi:LAS superfamily LD-carboxypeptidase LdcB